MWEIKKKNKTETRLTSRLLTKAIKSLKLYTEDSTQISSAPATSFVRQVSNCLFWWRILLFEVLSYYSIYRKQGGRDWYLQVVFEFRLPSSDVCSKPSNEVGNSCGGLAVPIMMSVLVSSSLDLKEDKEADNISLAGHLVAQCWPLSSIYFLYLVSWLGQEDCVHACQHVMTDRVPEENLDCV